MLDLESPEVSVSDRNNLFGSKLSVSDSFDEDENSEDGDDEVFIQNGKHARPKKGTETGINRPLMPPRRKVHKSTPFESNIHRRALIRALKGPCCFTLLFLTIFIIAVGSLSLFFNSFLSEHKWKEQIAVELVAPKEFSNQLVWNSSFQGINPKGTLYAVDTNSDGVVDILMAFEAAISRSDDPGFVCAMYYQGQYPCYGGVLAVDGVSGQELWRHWTEGAVLSLDCSTDLTKDGVNDCLTSGNSGFLHAVNGHDGSMIWSFPAATNAQISENDLFSPRFIPDVNDDGKQDLVLGYNSASSVCGHSSRYPQGHLLLLSGATGEILQCTETIRHANITSPPTLLVMPEGSVHLIISLSTRDESSLVLIPLHPQQGILTDMIKALPANGKIQSTPPLLIDLNSDGSADIVVAAGNELIAIDGKSLKKIWTYQKSSDYYIEGIIQGGYFSNDTTADIVVKFSCLNKNLQEIDVVDGTTGSLLSSTPIKATDGINLQIVSVEGFGNDFYLFWTLPCKFGHDGQSDCTNKDNTSELVELRAQVPLKNLSFTFFNQKMPNENLDEDWQMATNYLSSHPDFWDQYVNLICAAENSAEEALSAQQPETIETVGYENLPHSVRKHGQLPGAEQPLYSDYDFGNKESSNFGQSAYEELRPRRAIDKISVSADIPVLASRAIILPRIKQFEEGLDFVYTVSQPSIDDSVTKVYQKCLFNKISHLRINRKRIMMSSCQQQAKELALDCWKEATQMTLTPRPFGAARIFTSTVFRQTIRLKCGDQNLKDGQRCAGILPWNMQSLPRIPGLYTVFFTRKV
ncbi:uncharacterized protein LOC132200983 [Neocloeon triangulifer]|uniref:uncharacterized protein LOC132200983 n=1 Tax=Neocloeon triangulifer TaxID=2078957 RepID=UPI00286F81A0|nr:uncharacterized protein LOC132200983 [Neocloeon triangulifer]